MPVVSLAQQFRKLNSCICLKYHLSDKLKAQNKFSPITHKLNVFISSARHSSCPYDPVKKMCFILVDFKLDEKIPNTDFFWSVFSCMWTDYRKIQKIKNFVLRPFLRSGQLDFLERILLQRIFLDIP